MLQITLVILTTHTTLITAVGASVRFVLTTLENATAYSAARELALKVYQQLNERVRVN
jgi:hypothetical protein